MTAVTAPTGKRHTPSQFSPIKIAKPSLPAKARNLKKYLPSKNSSCLA
jgi:hypothetical protein